jgi:hypothetical protein
MVNNYFTAIVVPEGAPLAASHGVEAAALDLPISAALGLTM